MRCPIPLLAGQQVLGQPDKEGDPLRLVAGEPYRTPKIVLGKELDVLATDAAAGVIGRNGPLEHLKLSLPAHGQGIVHRQDDRCRLYSAGEGHRASGL